MLYFICIGWWRLHFISGIRYIFMKLLQLFSPKRYMYAIRSGNGLCCLYNKVNESLGSLSYRQRFVEFCCNVFDLSGKFGSVGFFFFVVPARWHFGDVVLMSFLWWLGQVYHFMVTSSKSVCNIASCVPFNVFCGYCYVWSALAFSSSQINCGRILGNVNENKVSFDHPVFNVLSSDIHYYVYSTWRVGIKISNDEMAILLSLESF